MSLRHWVVAVPVLPVASLSNTNVNTKKTPLWRLFYVCRACPTAGGESPLPSELKAYLTGWMNYYSLNEYPSITRNLIKWIRRRLRSLLWKQWKTGRSRYNEPRTRGVGRDFAAQTVGSCHKQWQISQSPALCITLPNKLFREMGLPDM